MDGDYEDNYWPEDAIFMERNSRDFISRVDRINTNAEAICETLKASPIGELVLLHCIVPADCHVSRGGILPEV